MPIVQAQGDQVRTQLARQPRASANVHAAAFGAPITEGLVDLAQAGLNINKRIDTTSAEEALVSFERDKNNLFFDPNTGYFNTQGRNAYDGAGVANSALEGLKKKYGTDLSPQARRMFDATADIHITRAGRDIGRHASKGLQTWETATLDAQTENTLENASLYWSDPDQMRVQRVIGEQSIIDSSKTTGIGPEATAEKLQNYRSVFASNAVTAATQSSAAEGQAMLDQQSNVLEGPDKVKLTSAIESKQKAEKTQSDAQAAVLTSTNLVSQFDNRSDIIAEVNKIEDPELRKKTMSESMLRFGQKRQAQSEERADAFERAESHVITGGSAETYKAEDPEGWNDLSPKQQRSITSGKAVVTDWNEFSRLMIMPKSELAKVDPTDHYSDLAPAERKTLISAVKSSKGTGTSSDKTDHQTGRTRGAQTTSAVNQLFGKPSKLNKDKQEQVNAFYAVLDDEVNSRESVKGSKLTSEEYTNVLSGLTRSIVKEGLVFDTELDLTDIPADDVPVLSKFLRDNGVPVTSDNLIKAHIQATK